MTQIVSRLLDLIKESGLKDKEILKELDISNPSLITDWRKGKSTNPSIERIIQFSNYFGVSTDYILKGNASSMNTELVDVKEKEFISILRQLPINDREEIFDLMLIKLERFQKNSDKSFLLTATGSDK